MMASVGLSFLSLILVCCLLPSRHAVDAASVAVAPPPPPSPSSPSSPPPISTASPTSNPNNLDPHDKICRDYLKTFLKGVTDAKDECQGLMNAYDAADCSAEEGNDGGSGGDRSDPWRRWWHDLLGDDDYAPADDDAGGGGGGGGNGNGTITDDDYAVDMIDDYYENSACCSTIRSYYTVHCHEDHSLESTALLGIVTVLIVCGLVKSLLRTFEIGWLPEAAGCILVGSTAGLIVKAFHPELDVESMPFDDDLFLSILLPPIIFQATLAIDKTALLRNLLPVALFAIVGTVLSAAITGGIVFGLTRIAPGVVTPIPLLDSMIFGSLISSVDPVATLSVLSSVGVAETDTLYVLVFGESLLNDGVAIVLFRTLVSHLNGLTWNGGGSDGGGDGGSPSILVEVARKFSVVTAGSALVGLACGAACTIYFRTLRGRHPPVVEVAIFFCWALVPYYVGDILDLSGIIAIMTAGFFVDVFVIGHRAGRPPAGAEGVDGGQRFQSEEEEEEGRCMLLAGYGCLSQKSRNHIGFVTEVISSIMETAIFAYLGLFLFADKQFRQNTPLNFASILSCIISRVIMVGLLSFVINVAHNAYGRCRQCCGSSPATIESNPDRDRAPTEKVVDRRMQLILLFSGIRGAVSLALVENIPLYNAVTKEGSKFKAELKAMASASIIFTVFVFGASTYFLLAPRGDRGSGRSCGTRGGSRQQRVEEIEESTSSSLGEPLLMESGAAAAVLVEDNENE